MRRIVLSRKGFDSSTGGMPSYKRDQALISFPIPSQQNTLTTYSDIGLGKIIKELSNNKLQPTDTCHFDPNLEYGEFGQVGAAQTHLKNNNVKVDNDIIEHLAKNITSNVRELEGAYRRLCAHVELVNRPLTLDTAKQILHDIFKANNKNVTIEEIQKRVSEYFNIRQSDMLSTRRSRVVARPRQIAMYLSKICTTKSLPEIGKQFGGRDHTTVIHAVKKVESLYKTDISFSEHIKILKKSFI